MGATRRVVVRTMLLYDVLSATISVYLPYILLVDIFWLVHREALCCSSRWWTGSGS